MEARKTPLYERHVAAGGRIVAFAGYLLPVQYEGVLAEHAAVRASVGLFDVSHMGEVMIEGPRAAEFVERLITNTLDGMRDGQVRYSPMCYESGGVVDDLLIYRLGPERYLLVVNASNRDKDYAFMRENNPMGASLSDISDSIAQLAVQGPRSAAVLERLTGAELLPERYYTFREDVPVAGIRCLVSRTGYTGEDGFELYCPAQRGAELWDALLAAGADEGIRPCGLGARDTLRLEAGMPLYGHELGPEITPLMAGLTHFVRFDKPDFIGRDALLAQKAAGPQRRRAGIVLTDRGIAREGARIFSGEREVGVVTSGTQSPTLRQAVALSLVEPPLHKPGAAVKVEVRGRMLEARTVRLPFYKRNTQPSE
ncbi:MAG: glycine cleavage system aminomethyltransferase GcvT [Clostridiales bacterium]|nr:glycine cleavage system aminomethyltransferase GcvT [Clostridiales bacterium]